MIYVISFRCLFELVSAKPNSHYVYVYVYVIKMNDAGKVAYVTKIWNSSWALRELGWA